ncbi:MAG: tRNA (adenine-N1)-methyltransferase [Synergistales bacterium]
MTGLKQGDLVLLWSPKKGDRYLIRLTSGASQSTHLGLLRHDELIGLSYGDPVLSNTGHDFFLLKPSIGEYMRRIRRQTQIVFPKEAGYILLHLSLFPGARVIECGSGSGSLTTLFANMVGDHGRVFSYDRRADFTALAHANCERWGVSERVEFKVRDLADGFDETDADAVFLDVQAPEDYLRQVRRALAPGRQLGLIVPTTNQLERIIPALQAESFVNIEILELLLRRYKATAARLRPEDVMVGHTGFLVFATAVRGKVPCPENGEE